MDLHDANLRAADLLMADLRDTCLVRANFRDSCLVGANLEAANLEGASLETSMGLVPHQLAGANLHEATLPPHILQFEALAEFKRASRTVHGYFVAMMSLSALSWLIIWMTKDFQLLTNSAILPLPALAHGCRGVADRAVLFDRALRAFHRVSRIPFSPAAPVGYGARITRRLPGWPRAG